MLIAITGVILVYPTQSASLLLGDPSRQSARQTRLNDTELKVTTEDKLNTALAMFPGATLRWVRPPTQDYEKFIVGVQQAGSWNRLGKSYVVFANHQAEEKLDALAQTADKRLFDFMFPLHTGMLGVWYRAVLTLFGVLLITVSIFGVWSWLLKRNY